MFVAADIGLRLFVLVLFVDRSVPDLPSSVVVVARTSLGRAEHRQRSLRIDRAQRLCLQHSIQKDKNNESFSS